ncbi:MAG: ribonuclease HI family protein [candidate division WWE3 bacterium]|nr:ribonuclease HI family protein [candidate division WWE3 bacterium]
MRFFLFTDGASRGNPGPAAAGVVLKDEKGKVLLEASQVLGRMTNNESEYRALLLGLTRASSLVRGQALVVLMDSELVVSQLCGRYRIKAAHLRELLLEVRLKEKPFGKVIYKLIPREKNAQADELANQALDR